MEQMSARTDRSLRLTDLGELNDTGAFGARALEQDLRQLYLASCLEELNKILIGSRPGKLSEPSARLLARYRCPEARTLRTMICWLGSALKWPPPPPPKLDPLLPKPEPPP